MSQQEYEDYKSKYFILYHKHREDKDKVSVLDDVDFCIELMESDKINVAYIMNLIRNVRMDDEEKRKKDIDFIRSELKRADNAQLHKKVDLLQSFLDMMEQGLDGRNIDEAYEEFENAESRKKSRNSPPKRTSARTGSRAIYLSMSSPA